MTALRERTARIDAAIGAVPMVRLALVWLLVISAGAVVGSVIGQVAYPVPDLLALLAVVVVASWASARIAALLVRFPAHDESALVTGLILFLIVPPGLTAGALLTAVAVAVVATATKYVIRIRGRHVLNPAAAGLLLVGLTGLPVSYWWVGTPFLTPLVLLATAVIAVRLRLVLPVGVLIVVGAALITAASLARDFPLDQTLRNVLLSGSLLFLAGVMFTEPVTLPPARWQRLTEAAIVAALLALPYVAPFEIGPLATTPELALIVGNVFAAIVARPVAARLRFAGRRQLTPTAVEYAFRPERPLRHGAGQYLELHLPHRADRRGSRRSLTIVSPPGDDAVRVAVRSRDPRSSFKALLDELPQGAELRAVTVTGGFTLPADRRIPLLLVASGIGITPFISQLRHDATLVAAGAPPRDVLLVDRVPSADEIPYRDELVATGVRVLLICADPPADLPEHWHAATRFDAAALAAVLPDPSGRLAYASGSARFLATARTVLRQAGVRRIRTDAFAGY